MAPINRKRLLGETLDQVFRRINFDSADYKWRCVKSGVTFVTCNADLLFAARLAAKACVARLDNYQIWLFVRMNFAFGMMNYQLFCQPSCHS